MAIRNEKNKDKKDMSLFGDRLIHLMVCKGNEYNSAHKLASALYHDECITVDKKHKQFEDPDIEERQIIWRIQKKVTAHMRADTVNRVQGEYIYAYCKFFGCSADYLIGLTDIQSGDIEVRQICERTGLSEDAVLRLTKPLSGDISAIPKEIWFECWSRILESELFYSLPDDWLEICHELLTCGSEEADIQASQWLIDNSDDDVLTGIQKGKIKTLSSTVKSRRSAFYGLLAKVSRDISVNIEQKALEKCMSEEVQKHTNDSAMEFVQAVLSSKNKTKNKT